MASAVSPPASLEDFLAAQPFLDSNSGTFADLLAEFTLSGNVLSPEAMGVKSPVGGGEAKDHHHAGGGSNSDSSPEGLMLEQMGMARTESTGRGPSTGNGQGTWDSAGTGQMGLLAQAIAGMDTSTQSQLLNALLARQQQQHVGPPESAASSPQLYPTNPQPPGGFPSLPPSQHNSPHPQPYSNASSPQPQGYHYQPATSLPPSLVASPVASPYLNGGQGFYPHPANNYVLPPSSIPTPQPQPQPQQMSSSSAPGTSFQNAFSSPRPFTSQTSMIDPQMQLTLDMLGVQQNVNDQAWQARGSQTGDSYASTANGEEWGENEFLFSPLMSPAMTPRSAYSANSSLPPSTSYFPTNPNLVTPGDLFASLGSPAILPMPYDSPQLWPQGHHSHRNSLQGLVDQTQALAFDASQYQTMSPHMTAVGSSSSSSTPTATDAGQATATGSGRRGAGTGSRKTRPSPLLKPTPDGAIRRKKSEKRSSSIGSAGARSLTSSPFLGASTPAGVMTPLTAARVANPGSTKPSPEESASGSSGGGFNTPSPVDLTMGEPATSAATEAPGLMAPPPPPSSTNHSRQNSVHKEQWFQPVTPASLMNFTNELDFSGLAMQQNVANGNTFANNNGGQVRNENQTMDSTPQDDHLVASTSSTSTSTGPTKIAMKPSAGPGVAVAPKPTPTSAVAKGKAKAASTSAGAAGGVGTARKVQPKPAAKSGTGGVGTLKIKPLLPNGLAPDALARLSSKSNYQNIMDGRGVDLLGLDPSTVSALNATQGAGADVRRTSHKAAEQKRRDSLKQCFEQLRRILPPIAPGTMLDEEKRPGEGNVGGQRSGSIDPDNPNRGVSKAALLRRSNEYVGVLHDRIDRRDYAIESLRAKLRELKAQLGMGEVEGEDEGVEGLDLDNIDRDEKAAGNMAFYEAFDSDDETEIKPKAAPKKTAAARRKSTAADAEFKLKSNGVASRRSTRRAAGAVGGMAEEDDEDSSTVMDVEFTD